MDFRLPEEFKTVVNSETKLKYYSKNPLKSILIQRFFSKLIKMIQEVNPGEILEIGAGDGIAGFLISRNIPGLDYYASDIQTHALLNSSRILTRNLVGLDARILPFPDKSFELVVCLEVFEHIQEWQKVLQEGLRVSSKSFIFSVPLCPWYQLSNFVFLKNLSRWGEHPSHIHKFTIDKLQKQSLIISNSLKYNIKFVKAFPWILGKVKI